MYSFAPPYAYPSTSSAYVSPPMHPHGYSHFTSTFPIPCSHCHGRDHDARACHRLVQDEILVRNDVTGQVYQLSLNFSKETVAVLLSTVADIEGVPESNLIVFPPYTALQYHGYRSHTLTSVGLNNASVVVYTTKEHLQNQGGTCACCTPLEWAAKEARATALSQASVILQYMERTYGYDAVCHYAQAQKSTEMPQPNAAAVQEDPDVSDIQDNSESDSNTDNTDGVDVSMTVTDAQPQPDSSCNALMTVPEPTPAEPIMITGTALERTVHVSNVDCVLQKDSVARFLFDIGVILKIRFVEKAQPQAYYYVFIEFASMDSARALLRLNGAQVLGTSRFKIQFARDEIKDTHPTDAVYSRHGIQVPNSYFGTVCTEEEVILEATDELQEYLDACQMVEDAYTELSSPACTMENRLEFILLCIRLFTLPRAKTNVYFRGCNVRSAAIACYEAMDAHYSSVKKAKMTNDEVQKYVLCNFLMASLHTMSKDYVIAFSLAVRTLDLVRRMLGRLAAGFAESLLMGLACIARHMGEHVSRPFLHSINNITLPQGRSLPCVTDDNTILTKFCCYEVCGLTWKRMVSTCILAVVKDADSSQYV